MALGELMDSAAPDRARGDLRVQISHEALRDPYVEVQQIEQGLIGLACIVELQRRDADPFLVDLGRVGRHRPGRHAPDILMMGHRRAERDRPALVEHRHDQRDVRQVCPTVVGIVHHVDVALAHLGRRELDEHLLHHRDQGREMDGDGGGLRDGLPFDREEARGGIEAFLDDRRERAPEQRRLHLVGDAEELVADHLHRDGVELRGVGRRHVALHSGARGSVSLAGAVNGSG